MIRFLIAVSVLAFSVEANAQNVVCRNGMCYRVPAPVPQQVLVPRIQYQPYRYQSSTFAERRGPLRRLFLGRYRTWHTYAPVQQAK